MSDVNAVHKGSTLGISVEVHQKVAASSKQELKTWDELTLKSREA